MIALRWTFHRSITAPGPFVSGLDPEAPWDGDIRHFGRGED